MKKFIFTIFMMVACMTGYAQQTTVEGSKVFDNTSVSLYGGGMGWIDPVVVNADGFFGGVRPTFGVSVDKWITPTLGAEMYFDMSVNSFPFNSTAKRWTIFDFANGGVNGLVNLNNVIHKYKGSADKVEVVPFAGLGVGHGFTTSPGSNLTGVTGSNSVNFIAANIGSQININIGDNQKWQVTMRPGIHYMIAGENLPVAFKSKRSYTDVNVGVTYKFGHKTSYGDVARNFVTAYTVAEYTNLQKKYDALQEKYDALQDDCSKKPATIEVEKVVEKKVYEVVEKTKSPNPHFIQGSTTLDATSMANLDTLAIEMRSGQNKYVITGYASVEGDSIYNQNLSLKRADVVKNHLVNVGVAEENLETVGAGETTKFGESYEANRVVTIEKK